jgi:lipopolysaccharide biosynthesis glycosyltransferase/Flp pilus assembly protein TadD
VTASDSPALALVETPPEPAPIATDAMELVARGLDARARKDYGAALRLLEAACAGAPGNSNVEVELAFTLLSMLRLDEAETHYQRVLERSPTHSGALSGLGHIARKRGDALGALAYFEAAVAVEPRNTSLQLLLADVERSVRRLQGAKIRYEAVLKSVPGNATALLGLANISLQQSDPESAANQAEAAALEHPSDTDVQVEVARLLLSAGRWARAECVLDRTLQVAPGHVAALMLMSQLARQRGDGALGLSYLQRASCADPHNPNLSAQLGQALAAAGRVEAARTSYLLALKRAPRHLPALRGLAQLAQEQEDFAGALDYFKTAAQVRSQDAQLQVDIAATLVELQRVDEADAVIEGLLQRARAAGDVALQVKCFQYYCTGLQLEKAEDCLSSWVGEQPWPPGAIALVAGYYASCAQWDKVIELLQERHPPGPWKGSAEQRQALFEAVARAARQTGQYSRVLEIIERVTDLATDEFALNLSDQLREEQHLRRVAELAANGHEVAFGSSIRTRRATALCRTLTGSRGGESARTIYFCTDRAYLLGSITSLFSLLRHNLDSLWRYELKVYASEEVLPLAQAALAELTRAFSVRIELRSAATLVSKDLVFRTGWGVFTPGHALSEAAYYRIYAALQLQAEAGKGRALYVDSDTCIGKGLDQLLEHDLRGQPLGARTELGSLPTIRRAARKLAVDVANYFNSGVLLFDLSHPDLTPALQETVRFALTRKHLLTFLDQCALNVAFAGKVTELPSRFNSFVRQSAGSADADAVVTHFLERPKPWDPMYRSANCVPWVGEFTALGQLLPSELVRRLYLAQFPAQSAG